MTTAPNRRVALTLIEVLMTIFVLAIGLLGVAALLPLGQQQMKRGIVNQRTAELGDKALEALEPYGITNPARWVVYDATAPNYFHYDAALSNNTRIACPITAATSTTITTDGSLGAVADLYDNCFVEIIRSNSLLGLRRRGDWDSTGTTFTLASALPGTPTTSDVFVVKRSQPIAIDPYYFAFHAPSIAPFAPGVPRLTLTETDGDPNADLMNFQTATSLFVSSDDLIFAKPDDDDEPAQQQFYGEQFNDADGSGEFEGANEIVLIDDDFSQFGFYGGGSNLRHAVEPGTEGFWIGNGNWKNANAITVDNFSFEADGLGNGGQDSDIDGWNDPNSGLPGQTSNAWDPPNWQITPRHGSNVAFSRIDPINQTITDPNGTIQAGRTYTLQVEVWDSTGHTLSTGYDVELRAFDGVSTYTVLDAVDENSLPVAEATGNGGNYETATLTFNADDNPTLIGQQLDINLVGQSTSPRLVAFDNVRLTYTENVGDTADGYLHHPNGGAGAGVDGAIGKIIDVTGVTDTSLNELNLSLDHLAGDSSEQFRIHLWGYVDNGLGSLGNGTLNTGAQNGNSWESSGTGWDQYNLIRDWNCSVNIGAACSAQSVTATNAGWQTSTFAIDLTNLAPLPPAHSTQPPAPADLSGYDYIVLGIARAGSGSSLSIDNVILTATGVDNPSGDTFNPTMHDMDGDGEYTAELKRQSEGSYSWLATLVPAEGGVDTRYYTASVAAFYKRPVQVPVDFTQAGSPQTSLNLTFSPGLNYGGGRVTISTSNAAFFPAIVDDVNNSEEFEPDIDRVPIKANQWVLVTAGGSPPTICRWYRLGSVGAPYPNTTPSPTTWSIDARLIGADWDTSQLGTTATITFYEGLKGVFQRTMPIKTLPIGNVAP